MCPVVVGGRLRGGVLLGLLLVAWLAPSTAGAQQVRLHVLADSVTVGDRFRVAVVAEHDFMAEAQFPALADSARTDTSGTFTSAPLLRFGDLEVLGSETFDGGDGASPSGSRIDSVVYEVTTFAIDSAVVAPIPVQFTAGEDTFLVRTEPAVLSVLSLVPPEAQGLRPLAPLAEFPRPLWPWVLLALAVLTLLGTLFYYLRERRRQEDEAPSPAPPPPVPPYDQAAARLQRLEEHLAATDGADPKPFFVELADLIRTYLQDRLHVPALESTTRELTHTLEQRSRRNGLPGEVAARVYAVLALADLVKFADIKPPRSQSEEAVAETRRVLDLIEETLVQRERAPSPDAEPSYAHPDRTPVPSDA